MRHILNKEVKTVNRSLSRRPNTFELYGRVPKDDSKCHIEHHLEGIVLDYDSNKFLRYQLSADTSEEKKKWCQALLVVLNEIRFWDFSLPLPVDDILHS